MKRVPLSQLSKLRAARSLSLSLSLTKKTNTCGPCTWQGGEALRRSAGVATYLQTLPRRDLLRSSPPPEHHEGSLSLRTYPPPCSLLPPSNITHPHTQCLRFCPEIQFRVQPQSTLQYTQGHIYTPAADPGMNMKQLRASLGRPRICT